MFDTILVPTDGSDHAAMAVEVASNLAAQCDARVVLLYAIAGDDVPEAVSRYAEIENLHHRPTPIPGGTPQPTTLYGSLPVTDAMPSERLRGPVMHEIAERFLEQAETIARTHGVNAVEVVTENGDPADTILDSARRMKADAIVMGSRGLGSVRSLFGSVSQKVAHEARCACITVTNPGN